MKKILDVYNSDIYAYLQKNKIIDIPEVIEMREEDHQLTIIEEFISGTSLQDILLSGGIVCNSSDTVLLGMKGYAAPEQYGFGSSAPQTDIYAMGILLKELSSALPVPTDKFNKIIQKCTRINPSDRFESAALLKQEIMKIGEKPSLLPDHSFAGRTLIPPGYRTLTPWKMLVSTMIYLFVFVTCSL